jgi:hypothetical protein
VEQAVDMTSGAIVAVTTHPGAAPDTETIRQTVCAAGEQVAEWIPVVTEEGEAPVDRVLPPKGATRWISTSSEGSKPETTSPGASCCRPSS